MSASKSRYGLTLKDINMKSRHQSLGEPNARSVTFHLEALER